MDQVNNEEEQAGNNIEEAKRIELPERSSHRKIKILRQCLSPS